MIRDFDDPAVAQSSPFVEEDSAYLLKRGVPLEYASAAGLRSLTADEAGQHLGRGPIQGGGLGIPYRCLIPEYWRTRLRQGQVRFLAPEGREVPVYWPANEPLIGSLESELCIVEGPIKALALCAAGIPAVGLGGTGTTLATKGGNRTLNATWAAIPLADRKVVVLFDSGRSTNPNVARDEARLVLALEAAGAQVRVAKLPPGERGADWGPDDLLAARGAEALNQVIGAALPGEPLSRVAQIAGLEEIERTTRAANLLSDFPFMASVLERGTGTEVAVGARLREIGITASVWNEALKEQKKKRKAAAKSAPSRTQSRERSDFYRMENGRTFRIRTASDGTESVEDIANFEARIVEDRVLDDGLNRIRRFSIQGVGTRGYRFPPVELASADFEKPSWPLDKWGAAAQLSAERSSANHLRAAIQAHSAPTNVTVFTHTGWRDFDGTPCFLHAAGCIGSVQAQVVLDGPLARYSLPPPKAPDLPAAFNLALSFINVAKRQVTVPLFCAAFRAPVQSLLPADFTLWLYGQSGSLKSTLAALALSFYGEAFDSAHLPLDWGATAASIEHRLFLAKDVLMVIDDFAPRSADPSDDLRRKADVILRSIGNQSARGRMRADMSAQPDRAPRTLAISTGEDLPTGESILARILALRVERGTVQLPLLSTLQEQKRLLPQVMTAYLGWMQRHYAELGQVVQSSFQRHFKQFSGKSGHLRSPAALANLAIGADLFAAFAEEIGYFTSHQADAFVNSGVAALMELTEVQASIVEQSNPTDRFLSTLRSLVAQGRAGISDDLAAKLTPSPGVEPLGWRDQQAAYLLPEATYRLVARTIREAGGSLPLSASPLWDRLLAGGYILEVDSGRTTKKKILGGDRHRVVFLRLDALDP